MPVTIQHGADYLVISGDGFASLAEAQQHFRDLSTVLVAKRKGGMRHVRLMVDLSASAAHAPEVEAHIKRALPILYQEGDRVAVIVRSTGLKVQTRTTHDPSFSEVFLTREAAEEYLNRPEQVA